MVAGESHYFLGQRYRLRITEHEGASKVVMCNAAMIDLHARAGTSWS
jgi:hypothetical protein